MEDNSIHSHKHNARVYNRGVEMLRSPERTERLEVDRVIKSCLTKNIKTVIDIGTGSALFAEGFSKEGITVTGIDTNPEMIETARHFVPQGKFQLASAENIPFSDKSFDLAFFGVVFHEVDDYSRALKEAFRVTAVQTSILEWYYKLENFGPPLEHRLKSDFIKNLAFGTGFKGFEEIKLKHLVLYNLSK